MLAYCHRYVITDNDLTRPQFTGPETLTVSLSEEEISKMIDDLLNGFNPVYNVMDRRLYYEVTGC